MKPSGAHTHPEMGGGGLIGVAAVVLIIAIVAGPVVHAAEDLIRIVLIAAASLLGLLIAAVAALLVWRARHRPAADPVVMVASPEQRRAVPQPKTAAIPAPQVHLHLHGPVSADDVAAILRAHGSPVNGATLPVAALPQVSEGDRTHGRQ